MDYVLKCVSHFQKLEKSSYSYIKKTSLESNSKLSL